MQTDKSRLPTPADCLLLKIYFLSTLIFLIPGAWFCFSSSEELHILQVAAAWPLVPKFAHQISARLNFVMLKQLLQTYPPTAGWRQGVHTQTPQLGTPLGKLCTGTPAVKGKGTESTTSHPYSSRSRELQEGQGWNQTLYEGATSAIWTVRYFNKLSWKISLSVLHIYDQPRRRAALQPWHLTKASSAVKKVAAFRKRFSTAFPLQVRIPVYKEKKNIFIACHTEDRKGSRRDKLEDSAESVCTTNTAHETTTHTQTPSAWTCRDSTSRTHSPLKPSAHLTKIPFSWTTRTNAKKKTIYHS